MATEALFTQGGTYDAAELRKLIKGIWYSPAPGGVIEGLAVTVGGALSISVSPGYSKIDDATSGAYLGYSTGTSTVAIASNSGGGSTRNDTIYAQVLDPGSGLTAGEVLFAVATGTSTIPSLAIPLASVAVTTSNVLTVTAGARGSAEPMNTLARGSAASLAVRLSAMDSAISAVASGGVTLTGTQTLTNKNLADSSNVFPSGVVLPPGMIVPYAGAVAPSSWLLCAGQAVSRATYSALFTAIGVTFGAGDGSTTFSVPDLRGRVVAAPDAMGGTPSNRMPGLTLGASRGVALLNLTEAQLASHTHSVGIGNDAPDHSHTVNAHAHYGATVGHSADHSHYVSLGDGGHGHNSSYGNNYQLSTQDQNLAGDVAAPIANTGDRFGALFSAGNHGHAGQSNGASNDHSHGIHAEAPGTGGRSAFHQHPTSVSSAGSSAAVENVQPTLSLNYIIKA